MKNPTFLYFPLQLYAKHPNSGKKMVIAIGFTDISAFLYVKTQNLPVM